MMKVWPAAASVCALLSTLMTPPASADPGTRFKDCPVCPEMVVIPPGTFMMGSPAIEPGRTDLEGPRHRASIRQPIAVGRYEVSFAEWDACAADGACDGLTPSDDGWGRGERPVINVSWNDAKAYVAWLRQITGVVYRLLSETEWEYAARAGTTAMRIWGSAAEQACRYGNILDRGSEISVESMAHSHACEDGYAATAPVGSYAANRFALYDMVGNVSEWVEDCWYLGYVGAPADGSARSPSRGGHPMEPTAHLSPGDCLDRGHRGGSWRSGLDETRAASRAGHAKTFRANFIGFRVARKAPYTSLHKE
ncbi:MAG: formylglycine-generating enzyme family protein [Alphaproteobacteria bacterium]